MSQILPKPPATHTRLNSQGLIEVVDAMTGRILCVQRTTKDYLALKFEGLTRIDTPDGPVFIEKGIDVNRLRLVPGCAYSKVVVGLICAEIARGSGIIKACESVGVSYSLVCAWRMEHAECKEALEQARRDRAEIHADEALQKAKESKRPYLEVETYKWAAERGDPSKYGHQTKVTGDKNAPVAFVLDTGVRRMGDMGFTPPENPIPPIEIEAKKVAPETAYEVADAKDT